MSESKISLLRTGEARLRRGVLWVTFSLVLLIPKINRLRRNRRAWNFVRILLAITGMATLAFALEHGGATTLLGTGALMLLFAVFVQPERPKISVDARARELGALIVVDGGRYVELTGSGHHAKLFIGSDRLWVLNAALQLLQEIPLQQIRTTLVIPVGADWTFRVEWEQTATEFIYKGTFAEHLARVADTTLRSRLHRELPVLR